MAAISVSGNIQAKYSRDAFGALLGLQEGAAPATGALNDLHGDLVGTYTGTALVSSTSYGPFGEVTARTGVQNNLGYQGEYTDPDTGKVNMHARWYQPDTGTFTSRDTAALDPDPSVQANRYTYANASPLTGTDQTGHFTTSNNSWSMPGTAGWGDTSGGYTGNVCGGIINQCGSGSGSSIGDGGGPLACAGAALNFCGGFVPGEYWDVDRHASFSEDEARRTNVVDVGLGAGRDVPGADFWGDNSAIGKRARRNFAAHYDPLNGVDNEAFLWAAAKNAARTSNCVCLVAPAAAAGKFNSITCSSYYGEAACREIKETAKLAKTAQQFLNECLVDALERCYKWRDELGIDDKLWLRLRRENIDRVIGSGKNLTLKDFLDFFFGDAVDCLNGSMASCGLFAINFLPEVGVAAKAGVKGLGKVFGRLGSAGVKIAEKCNSFALGTLVLMSDGSRKPIEEIREGDQVLPTDPISGKTVARTVTTLISGSGIKNLTEITVTTGRAVDANYQSLIATAQHPFWVPSLQEWVDATYLQPGDWLRTSTGTWIQVAAVKRWTASRAVYNLSVADLNTYYVTVGTRDILVHNSNCIAGWVKRADFSDPSTMSKKFDAHAKDFDIKATRNKGTLAAFEAKMREHIMAPGTKIYRFNYRSQGQAVGFIDPKSRKMVMLNTYGRFWTAYKLNNAQFKDIIDNGHLW
ncbi:polymorphic toxin-type HINT domain-containing protein [Nonomuraea sp. NPDC001831]|uniref:polymorphic toxin-type HINT domain-containing protein n=1 Tax=Nonomuraea sp. NPDC001831 TaxID=3364340 RepID=UPI00368271D1